MSAIAISSIVFGCVFGGALAGMGLRAILPEHHRTGESKELVRAAMALIGTMSALVLGLLVGSAKSAYDAQKDELTSLSAGVLMVDRILSIYGPEAKDAREQLREVVAGARDQIWHGAPPIEASRHPLRRHPPALTEGRRAAGAERSGLLFDRRSREDALVDARSSGAARCRSRFWSWWSSGSRSISSASAFSRIPTPPSARRCFVCALSVAGAIFLILEMDRPFEGVIQISDAPLRQVLTQLGR